MNELAHVPSTNLVHYRASTDAATICRDIVMQTAKPIQGRRFVSVEGWMAIAIAHGCAAGSRDVQKVEGGVRATGEVRRMDDGQLIATAEGFVGEDEPTWYGGEQVTKWGKKVLPKRPDYAIRAMAQTRAISRACRSAFAHVVVMIDAGLSTTPAEEVPDGGFIEGRFREGEVSPVEPADTSSLREQLEQSVAEGPPPKKEPAHSKLKTALRGWNHELEGIADWDVWCAFRDCAETVDLLDQLKEKLPEWWDGGPDLPAEFVPYRRRIELKEAELAQHIADIARA